MDIPEKGYGSWRQFWARSQEWKDADKALAGVYCDGCDTCPHNDEWAGRLWAEFADAPGLDAARRAARG